MKKTILIISSLAGLLAQSARATITLTATPSTQFFSSTFVISLDLNVSTSPPPNMQAFDLVFEAAATQNGININNLFTITGRNLNTTNWGGTWADLAIGADPLGTLNSDHAGFVQTNGGGSAGNEGFSNGASTDNKATPFNLNLGTWTFSIASGTPLGTYTFGTTVLATSASKFSDVGSTSSNSAAGTFGNWPISNSAMFTITTDTLVPEPATWAMLCSGAVMLVAIRRFRSKG